MRPPRPSSTPSASRQRARPDAGGPHHHAGRQAGAVGELDPVVAVPVGAHAVDADAEAHDDAAPLQRAAGPLAARRPEHAEQTGRGLHHGHPHRRHVEIAEVLRQHLREQLHHRPGRLDPGRSTAAHDHVERSPSEHPVVDGGPLEALEHGPAQRHGVVEILQGDRVLGDAGRRRRWSTPRLRRPPASRRRGSWVPPRRARR